MSTPGDDLDTAAAPDPAHAGVADDPHVAGHGHSHGVHAHGPPPDLDGGVVRRLWIAVGVAALLTVIAVVVLWPGDDVGVGDPLQLQGDPIPADVTSVELAPCAAGSADRCERVEFVLTGGDLDGQIGDFVQPIGGELSVGDAMLVDAFPGETGELVFVFYDFQRGTPMMVLLVLFVAAVVALGRWRGVGAIAGLACSLLLIVWFTLPAILEGSNAFAVAMATASAIAFVALLLAHGVTASTAVALLSTLASLVATAILASIFVAVTNLTGLASDATLLVGGASDGIDPRGLLLAGIVIGALGVLDDVTVTQVSAVWELKRARPSMTTTELVRPALRIGRDHISSTVNTLFLAYAGAALPLLLLFTSAGEGFTDIVTRELVATEVVRALVGSIGLVASVPVATWLAAVVVTSGPAPEDAPTAA